MHAGSDGPGAGWRQTGVHEPGYGGGCTPVGTGPAPAGGNPACICPDMAVDARRFGRARRRLAANRRASARIWRRRNAGMGGRRRGRAGAPAAGAAVIGAWSGAGTPSGGL